MVTTTSSLIATTGMTPVAEIVDSRCLRRRLNGFDCSRCVDNCAANALTISDGKVQRENERCTGCGRCTVVCPAEAMVLADFELYPMLEECDSFEDTVFTCPRQKQAFPNQLPLPCVALLSIEALLFIALKGNGPVYFNLLACPTCPQFQEVEKFPASLARVQQTIGRDLCAELIALRDTSQLPRIPERDRRSFLFDLGGRVVSLVKNRYGTGEPRQSTEQPQSRSRRLPQKTALLEKVILAQDSGVATTLLAQCTPTISLTESCTLCPRCTGMCPTGAIKLERQGDNGKKLTFAATRCTGCGLCAAFCKMKAITVNAPLILRL